MNTYLPGDVAAERWRQAPDDGDKKTTSKAEVSGEVWRAEWDPLAHVAEEKPREKDMDIPTKGQEKKAFPGNSDVKCLRSRNTGAQPRGSNVAF